VCVFGGHDCAGHGQEMRVQAQPALACVHTQALPATMHAGNLFITIVLVQKMVHVQCLRTHRAAPSKHEYGACAEGVWCIPRCLHTYRAAPSKHKHGACAEYGAYQGARARTELCPASKNTVLVRSTVDTKVLAHAGSCAQQA